MSLTPTLFKKQKIIIPLLFLSLFASIRSEESCSDYIDNFPGYSCVFQQSVGEGARGTAFLVRHDDMQYIMKVQEKSLKSIEEKNYLTRLKDQPYIVQIYDCEVDSNNKQICLLEYGSKGSLYTQVINEDEHFESFRNVITFFKKILEGIIKVHESGIIHADLKLQNIVISSDFEPRIIDFDLAVPINELDTIRGTPKFMAPEIVKKWHKRGLVVYREAIDMYALGVIFYAMVKKSYPVSFNLGDYETMVTSEIEFDKGDYADFMNIVRQLVCLKNDRISAEELHDLLIQVLLKRDHEKLRRKDFYVMDPKYVRTLPRKKTVRESIYNDTDESNASVTGLSDVQVDEEKREEFSWVEIGVISLVSICVLAVIVGVIWYKAKLRNRITTKSFTTRLKKMPTLTEERTKRSDSHV